MLIVCLFLRQGLTLFLASLRLLSTTEIWCQGYQCSTTWSLIPYFLPHLCTSVGSTTPPLGPNFHMKILDEITWSCLSYTYLEYSKFKRAPTPHGIILLLKKTELFAQIEMVFCLHDKGDLCYCKKLKYLAKLTYLLLEFSFSFIFLLSKYCEIIGVSLAGC